MRTHYICILTIVFAFFSDLVKAQNKRVVDSLHTLVNQTHTHDTTKIKAYNDLGVQYATSNSKEALSYTKKALAIAKKNEVPRGKAGAYNCMGIVYYYNEKYDSALVCYQKALAINKKLNHKWGQAAALHQIGVLYMIKKSYVIAIGNFEESGEIFIQKKDTISYTKSIENIGRCHFLMGDQKKGTDYYIKAIKINEKIKDKEGVGRGYINLAHMLIEQKEYKKALSYLDKGMPVIKNGGNKQFLRNVLGGMAICYKELGFFDKALYYTLEALTLSQVIENTNKVLRYQWFLAEIYYEKEQYKESLTILKKIQNSTTDKQTLMLNYNLSAKCNFELHKIENAKKDALLSFKMAKKLNDKKGIKDTNLTLARIAEKEGNAQKALSHYKEYLELKDSLESNESKAYVMKLQTMYEAEKQEQQIKKQTYTITALRKKWAKSSLANNVFLIGLVLSFTGIGFIVFFSKKKVKTKELEKKELVNALTTKKKELAYQSLQITKKNKLLQELKQRLENLKETREDVRSNEQVYQKLIHAINFDITDDTSWEYFKTHFEQLHHDFYEKIRVNYPNITTNEIRLLAFIKLNLSSSEIATILNITKDSVKKAKYRLRKKLAIKSKEEFQELILAI